MELTPDARRLRTVAFTDVTALTVLLTTESLLFAVFAVAFSGPSPLARSMKVDVSRRGAVVAAATLTFLASGAAVTWCDLFLHDWPPRVADWFPIVAIATGILAQPTFAWAFVWSLNR